MFTNWNTVQEFVSPVFNSGPIVVTETMPLNNWDLRDFSTTSPTVSMPLQTIKPSASENVSVNYFIATDLWYSWLGLEPFLKCCSIVWCIIVQYTLCSWETPAFHNLYFMIMESKVLYPCLIKQWMNRYSRNTFFLIVKKLDNIVSRRFLGLHSVSILICNSVGRKAWCSYLHMPTKLDCNCTIWSRVGVTQMTPNLSSHFSQNM